MQHPNIIFKLKTFSSFIYTFIFFIFKITLINNYKMASKLILRSFKNLSSVNRVATDNLLHIKPNYFKPISVLHKNFSVSISSAQSSNANSK